METVDLVTVTTETITGYAFITETLPVATPSTTFRTISVKKYARPSTVSSVQTTEASQTAYAFSILSTSSEEESTSTTTFVPFTSSLSSSITSTQIVQSSTDSSSSITSESASVLPTPSTQIHILKTTTSSLPSSSSSSTQNEPAIQTTSSTQLPILLPTKTQTLITLPTTSIPKFTPSPPPAPSEEQFPARKPLTITFTTLGFLLPLATTKKTGAEGAAEGRWKGFEEKANDL
ncbi:hypothetical protein HYFRA_00000664 [Hymenoscyphus fraxineus]|uniref:Uncharacterized protein n=1 Tax=Hymenoscyphus fraxineus TaxID=746836 RepID=A0A9N9PLF3_9HELO|nr:hypothetical protein HYFRA_00000664 [Hymenoscyphus fraxineus]